MYNNTLFSHYNNKKKKKEKKTWCPKWLLNMVKRPKLVLDQFGEIHPNIDGPALHNNATMNSWSSGSCSVMYSNKLLSVLCLSGLQFVPKTVLLSKKSEAPRLDTHLPALLAPSTILWLQCHKQAPWQHAYTYSSKYQVSIYDASPESDESMPSHISSQNQKKKFKITLYYIKNWRPDFWLCNIIFMQLSTYIYGSKTNATIMFKCFTI